MQSQVRRAPHCFNMLRQIRVLQQCTDVSVEAHFEVAGLIPKKFLNSRKPRVFSYRKL